jgi:aquaporin Z
MGLTAVALICSPWGQRSGAHLNPGVTLAFLWLGKVRKPDAAFYIAAQFTGGAAGVWVASLAAGAWLRHPAVNYVVTVPGAAGTAAAFAAEAGISAVLIGTVLAASNSRSFERFTPWLAGALLACYIVIEAPVSGMSMNPARTLASAIFGGRWTALWVYFTAPPLGMLTAARLFILWRGGRAVLCAKLHHRNGKRCIFRCNYAVMRGREL